MTMRPLFLLSA